MIRTFCGILIFIFLTVVLAICGCDNDVEIKKPFVLAYVDQDWHLRIRWSDDGTTWISAEGGNPEIDYAPGIAASNEGLIYLAIFRDAVCDASMMMGLGAGNWDSSYSCIGDGYRGDIDSVPSIVHIDGNNWLVAFRNYNQARVYEFSSSELASRVSV